MRAPALIALAAVSILFAPSVRARAAVDEAGPVPAFTVDASRYAKLPLAFEEHRRGAGPAPAFLARGPGYRVWLTATEAFVDADARRESGDAAAGPVRLAFVAANRSPQMTGVDPLGAISHYFRGGAVDVARTGIESFAKVRVSDLYPGIDLVYYGTQGRLEYDLVVAPGADPSRVRFEVRGARSIRVDARGGLVLETGTGELTLERPATFQQRDGRREPVASRYVLAADNEVVIDVDRHDRGRELVIDPVLSFASYLGGSNTDMPYGVAVDADGNTYVAGYTYSTDFPLVSPYDTKLGRKNSDVFVTKFNAAGNALVYSTYLGGTGGGDVAVAIAVDATGSAYVTGNTSASDFPVTANAYHAGVTGANAFIARLAPAGNALVYSTYVPGATSRALAVDAGGNAYITGTAGAAFVTTPGALQATATVPEQNGNAFVFKLNGAGTAAVYATFLGRLQGNGIAVDRAGHAYVGGLALPFDLPVVNALQPAAGGGREGFVAKLDPAGTSLVYSTYLGGSLDDVVNAIAVDPDGNAYVAGETYSADFPVANAYLARKPGRNLTNSSLGSAFFAKLNAAGTALVYSSFLGGEICPWSCYIGPGTPPAQWQGDGAYRIALDPAGHAYVMGDARSYTFPLVDSLLPAKQVDDHAFTFVTKVARSGAALLYSSFVRQAWTGYYVDLNSGIPDDGESGLAVDTQGTAHVVGLGPLTTLVPTTGAYQSVTDSYDTHLIKLATPSVEVALAASAIAIDATMPITLTATVSDPALAGSVTFMNGAGPVGAAVVNGGTATLTVTLPLGIGRLSAVFRGGGAAADSPVLNVLVDNALACN